MDFFLGVKIQYDGEDRRQNAGNKKMTTREVGEKPVTFKGTVKRDI
jgi:hypothetical protein